MKAQEIADSIRVRIDKEEFKNGDRLKPHQLASEYNVDYGTIIHALNYLKHLKILVFVKFTSDNGTGYYVGSIPPPKKLRATTFRDL